LILYFYTIKIYNKVKKEYPEVSFVQATKYETVKQKKKSFIKNKGSETTP